MRSADRRPLSGIDFEAQPAVEGETGGHCDGNKARVDLIPPWFIEAMGWVLTYGAVKYAVGENWKGGIRVSRLLASVERHVAAVKAGEDADPESGLPHWAHAAVDLMMAEWMRLHKSDLDDRATAYPDGVRLHQGLVRAGLDAVQRARAAREEHDG